MTLICRLRYLIPGILNLTNEFLPRGWRILLLLYKIPDHKYDLFRFLRPKKFEVQLQDDFKDLKLCTLECSDLLDPDVDQQCV